MSDPLAESQPESACRRVLDRVRDEKRRTSRVLGAKHCANRARFETHHASRLAGVLAIALFVWLGLADAGHANSQISAKSLDEQVQEVKSDVLAIAAELRQLEEKLLYPSNTQLAVFVSLANGDALELDSVHIQIDGKPVAHHIYEFKELLALRKGGVQRIYTGNVSTGEHRMQVSMAGRLPGGSEFEEVGSFAFHKDVEPKIIDLSLEGRAIGGVKIAFGGE